MKNRKRTRSKNNKNKKKTRRMLKGGHDALKNIFGPLTIDSGIVVERFFNPEHEKFGKIQQDTWKIPIINNIRGYTYTPYNSLHIQMPIYFGKLPTQIENELYVPIYKYISIKEQMPIDPIIMDTYDYIKNILLTNVWNRCLNLARGCPFKSKGLRGRTTKSCCGFIAPAMAVVFHYAEEHLSRNVEITEAMYDLAIKMGINFYSKFTGYGESEYSWNERCTNWSFVIKEGTNILTFYERQWQTIGKSQCDTYHHFIIYRRGHFCIIIDAWAGNGGQRGEWIRIMRYVDINSLLNFISTTDNIEMTNQLLNAYFIVPHSINVKKNIIENLQTELLSVGAYNLRDWNDEMRHLLALAQQNIALTQYGGSH